MEKDKLSVMDVVAGSGPEAVAAVDRLGYRFLGENGYPEALGEQTQALNDVLQGKMAERGEELHCHGAFDGDAGIYSVWFSLRSDQKVLAVSSAVRLQGVPLHAPVPCDKEDEP